MGSRTQVRPQGTTPLPRLFNSSEESMDESEENVGETRDEYDMEEFGPGHLSQYLEKEVPLLR